MHGFQTNALPVLERFKYLVRYPTPGEGEAVTEYEVPRAFGGFVTRRGSRREEPKRMPPRDPLETAGPGGGRRVPIEDEFLLLRFEKPGASKTTFQSFVNPVWNPGIKAGGETRLLWEGEKSPF